MTSLPDIGAPAPLVLPEVARRRLANGLTVVAARRASVPLVEVRLGIAVGGADPSSVAVLTATLLSGTRARSGSDIATTLDGLGASLSATADADHLLVVGRTLSRNLGPFLAVLADILVSAAYPAAAVVAQRNQIADRAAVAEHQAPYLALGALNRLLYRSHPYAKQSPGPGQLRAVRPETLLALHAERLRPHGATLVLVGDLEVGDAVVSAERTLGAWSGRPAPSRLPPLPPLPPHPNPIAVVDGPGQAHACLRLALPALSRTDPDFPTLRLATTAFGGSFSSRLVEVLREENGACYAPTASIVHLRATSLLVIMVDVMATAASEILGQIWHQLRRLSLDGLTTSELERARRYTVGTLRCRLAGQGGLASALMTMALDDLPGDWLVRHLEHLEAVSNEDVTPVTDVHLRPDRAVSVVLGDRTVIEAGLAGLAHVEVAGPGG